jgi:hypothetical protein
MVTSGLVADSTRRVRALPVLCLVAATPLLGAGLVALMLVIGWIAGASPFWTIPQLSLSEAVVTRDAGEVVRLIRYENVDPDQPWPVRAELLPGGPRSMTPMEAAVVTRRIEMVRLLAHRGARLPAGAARDRLICQAAGAGASDIVDFLLADGAGDPRARCVSPVSSVD